jgi:poly(beta-D-mannuronate) lyase
MFQLLWSLKSKQVSTELLICHNARKHWDHQKITPQLEETFFRLNESYLSNLEPGDVMIMEEGDWTDARITLTAAGSPQPGRKIYLQPAVEGRTRLTGKVQLRFEGSYLEARGIWIDGVSDDKITPVWFEKGSNNCRFTNSAITNFNRADHFKAHHWIEIFGSYHSIDHVSLERKIGDGQLVRVKTDNGDFKPPGAQPDSWGHIIAYNYFGPREEDPDDNGEGIQIGLMESEAVDTDTIVEFNLFDRYDGEMECISVKASHNVLRYNTFESSACTITLRHTDDTEVRENYFLCRGKYGCGGVRTYGSFHHVVNNYIEGDNFSATSRGGLVLYRGLSTTVYTREATDNMFEGNLIIDCEHCIIADTNVSVGGDIHTQDNAFKDNIFVGKDDNAFILK